MRENDLYRALDASVTGCQPSDYWKNRMVRQIVKGEEMRKRTKLSVGAILVAALLVISAVALAVGVLVNEYYAKVAQMEREGALERWQLEDKIQFVTTMKECNFELAEDLYLRAVDETLPDGEREAAADEIINNTYGELIRERIGYYQAFEEDSLGVAPDVETVFNERYFAEHPDWEETYEGVQAYFDALGYYLRDEIHMLEYTDTVPVPPVVDEAYAVNALKTAMTEEYEWDREAVEAMTPQAEWDAEYRMWTVTGEVSDESMEKATDPRRDMNPLRNEPNMEKTGDGYRAFMLVDDRGNTWTLNRDKEEFRKQFPDEELPVEKISVKQAAERTEKELKEKYGVTDGELKEMFSDMSPAGTGEENGRLYRIDYHPHYYYSFAKDLRYTFIVNMATGKIVSGVDYRAAMEAPEWQLLEYAAAAEEKGGWYSTWKPETKQGLVEKIRACGLLPEHAYWQEAQPAEADTDAFVAEVFGAAGHVSLVNARVMFHAVKGEESSWDPATELVADRLVRMYDVSSEDLRTKQDPGKADIDAAEAERIVKAAVCEAWGMPGDALDRWETVTRQQKETDIVDPDADDPWQVVGVYYRVFLTRPDEEVGQDTFGGLDNFNYRVAMDGTVLTTERHPGWYSPKEDKERWSK